MTHVRPYGGGMWRINFMKRAREAVREYVVVPVEQESVNRILCYLAGALLLLILAAANIRNPA